MGNKLPAHWPSRLVKPDCAHCNLDGDLLSCSLGAVPIPTSREDAVHACVLRANHPVPRDVLAFYFEMKVVQRGDRGDITLGFIPRHAKQGVQPGLVADSFGLNGVEGQVFRGAAPGESLTHAFRPGDVLGAGIVPAKGCVFVTRNGKTLTLNAGEVPRGVNLLPCADFSSDGEFWAARLSVRLGDAELSVCELLQELLQQERAAVCSEVREEDIDRSHLHTVVRDFLVAHAYEDTLSHFDHAYSQRALPCLSRQQQRGPTHYAGIRKQVYAAIVGRNTDLAMQLVESHFPEILSTSSKTSASLYLCCQNFIDKLMVGNIEEALVFAQQRLRPFKQCGSSQQHLLRETLALLAYPDPAEAPMSYLVSDEHRRKAARVVNAAILFHLVNTHSDSDSGMGIGQDEGDATQAGRDEVYLWRPWPPTSVLGAPSFLERMMQQLCVVQKDLGSAGGMRHGVDFTLQDAVDMMVEDSA